ncbi:TPA: hypothetical protein N0F65_007150 [Lagenidium giganteum]|uniref:Uncharacterized protein n=1 Tax=Lagenidium giganteum TaxID=4803 RepID=A0AAV2YX25_9STRA|nr:TPA: hypothetical protein N0F65_007150 [Lagenidium giganteum]
MERVLRPRNARIGTLLARHVQRATTANPIAHASAHVRAASSALNVPIELETTDDKWHAASNVQPFDTSAVVAELKTLCNGLRNDRREAPAIEDSLATWNAKMAAILTTDATTVGKRALTRELVCAYESGVAIACKQRQFSLARGLVAQMRALGLQPSHGIYCYLVKSVGLELASRPRSRAADELHDVVGNSPASWERDTMAIIRTEDAPHYLKNAKERQYFHRQLLAGVSQVLDEYEAAVPKAERSMEPLNQALVTLAYNRVPFHDVVKQMVHRSIPVNVDTYVALLQCARWTSLPATLTQLRQSGLVDKLFKPNDDAAARKGSFKLHLLWQNAMKSICNSFTDQFFDRSQQIRGSDLTELQHIYDAVESQLRALEPVDFEFATMAEHNKVYVLRIKAAAMCGLSDKVLSLLREYKDRAPCDAEPAQFTKEVYLCALELVATTPIDVMSLAWTDIQKFSQQFEVSTRLVSDLEGRHAELVSNVIPALKDQIESLPEGEEREAVIVQLDVAHGEAERLVRAAHKARVSKSQHLAVRERFRQMDKETDAVIDLMHDDLGDRPELGTADLELTRTLVKQYMSCANRYGQRLTRQRRSDVAEEVMKRVFRLVHAAAHNKECYEALSAEEQEQVNDVIFVALRTATLFWRREDAEKLMRIKKTLTERQFLDVREYDLLIFLHMAEDNVQAALLLLQELHNAGLKPSRDTIHRIAMGRLMRLNALREHENEVAEETSGEESLEDGADDKIASVNAEQMYLFNDDVSSIVSFIQEWYNLHGVKPFAKTVVPLLARLISTRDHAELARFVQILDSMTDGMTPATQLWLEKKLGRTGLDALRARRR